MPVLTKNADGAPGIRPHDPSTCGWPGIPTCSRSRTCDALVEAAAAVIAVPHCADSRVGATTPPTSRRACRCCKSAAVALDFSPGRDGRGLAHSVVSPRRRCRNRWRRRCRDLAAEIETTDSRSPAHPGLLHYLWMGGPRPVTWHLSSGAFDAWRDEERWLRNYCPTCGEPPAMAQLVGKRSRPPAHAVVRPLPDLAGATAARVVRSATPQGRTSPGGGGGRRRGGIAHRLTATRAAAISRPTTARGARASCSPTGRHSTST